MKHQLRHIKLKRQSRDFLLKDALQKADLQDILQ